MTRITDFGSVRMSSAPLAAAVLLLSLATLLPSAHAQSPEAVNDFVSTAMGTAVDISVLDNDWDPNEDDELVLWQELVDYPTNGTVVMADTSITYTPNPGFHGYDSFRYAIHDGMVHHQDTAVVTIYVEPADPEAQFIPYRNGALDLSASNTAYAHVRRAFMLPNAPSYTAALTIETWLKLTDAGDDTGTVFEKLRSNNSTRDLVLRLAAGALALDYRKADGTMRTVLLDAPAITSGTGWVHVAATVSFPDRPANGTVALHAYFPETALSYSSYFSLPDPPSTQRDRVDENGEAVEYGTMNFGSATAADWLPCQISEFRVWNAARTDVEIAQERGLPIVQNIADTLIAYYRFDNAQALGFGQDLMKNFRDPLALDNDTMFGAYPKGTAAFALVPSDGMGSESFSCFQTDADDDSIPDYYELILFGDVATAGPGTVAGYTDADRDSLSDLYEYVVAYNANLTNSAAELAADADADGMTLLQEQYVGLDPTSPDTDDDGLLDGAEIAAATDPVNCRSPLTLRVLEFDAGDSVTFPVNNLQQKLNLDVFTVELWVRPGGPLADDATLLRKLSDGNTAYALSLDAEGDVTFTVGSRSLTSAPDARLRAGLWSHIAGACDGTDLTLTVYTQDATGDYQTFVTAVPLLYAVPMGDGVLALGASTFSGALDEARVWSAARTGAEIAASRPSVLSGSEADLAAYWPFDDAGATVEDLTSRQVTNVVDLIDAYKLRGTVDGAAFADGAAFPDDVDSDGDGVSDAWEVVYFGDLTQDGTADGDGDGVNDLNESLAGTDPTVPQAGTTDTDGDGLTNQQEQQAGTNPALVDTDDDGLTDALEMALGTGATDSLSPLVNRALYLADDSDYAEVETGPAPGPAMTLEAWVRLAGVDNTGVICESIDIFDGAHVFELELAGGVPRFSWRTAGGVVRSADLLDATPITDLDGWVHISVALDTPGAGSGTVRLSAYRSGTDETETFQASFQGGVYSRTGPFCIGSSTPDASLTAWIDDVRVWNVARAGTDIESGRDGPIDPANTPADLLGYWRFDDGGGSAEDFAAGHRLNDAVSASRNAEFAAEPQNGAAIDDVDCDSAGDETYEYLSADSDTDGIADFWELRYFADLTTATAVTDSDGDTMTDLYEFYLGWLPYTTNTAADLAGDKDRDGLRNRLEQDNACRPDLADTDDDGMGDYDEVTMGVDPLVPDTDEDGIEDGAELARETDPADPRSPLVPRVLALDDGGTMTVPVNGTQPKLNLEEFTVEFWVNPDRLPLAQPSATLLARGTNYAVTIGRFGQIQFTVGAQSLLIDEPDDFYVRPDRWTHIAMTCDVTELTDLHVFPGSNPPYIELKYTDLTLIVHTPDNAGTYTTTTEAVRIVDRLYLDNTLVQYAVPTTNADLVIGAPGFVGSVDEVRIWDHARTVADIAAIRSLPLNDAAIDALLPDQDDPDQTALVAYWPFDDGGLSAQDFAARGAAEITDMAGVLSVGTAEFAEGIGGLAAGDADQDGLADWEEAFAGSNPALADTDGDLIEDGDDEGVLNPAWGGEWVFDIFTTHAQIHQFTFGMKADTEDVDVTDGYDFGIDLLVPPGAASETIGSVALKIDGPDLIDDFRGIAASGVWLIEAAAPAGDALVLSWNTTDAMAVRLLVIQVDQDGDTVVGGTRTTMDLVGSLAIPAGEIRYYRIVFGYAETTFDLELAEGWNLLSIPIEPFDASPDAVFAGATTIWEWTGIAYARPTEILPKRAYWVFRFGPATTTTITGRTVTSRHALLTEGWNLIGPVSTAPVAVPIVTDPADVVETVFWRYDTASAGYQQAAELTPGLGYWGYASANCLAELGEQ